MYSSAKDAAAGSLRRCNYNCYGDLSLDEDGHYYCTICSAQSQDFFEEASAGEDIFGPDAAYKIFNQQKSHTPAEELPHGFVKNPSLPMDLGSEGRCHDAEEIRFRYVQGLQVMLQLQCEALVEKFGVNPLICGFAGTVWLRYVAASMVFDEGWADKAIAESEGGEQDKKKFRLEGHNRYGKRAICIWFRCLRKTIPLCSSLAISYLVCHLARASILPTDISDWALEGKLPYLASFLDIDKYLGNPSNACPLSSRRLFRPIRAVGPWHLEATAASIAQAIGLRIPSVNFHAIACRYLKELSLPVEKILPHACHLYEWSIPAELWLSSNINSLPAHVCVMSILIVAVRILFNIHGQGTWEMSLSNLSNHPLHNQEVDKCSAPKLVKRDDEAKEFQAVTDSVPAKNSSCMHAYAFNTEELLLILEAAYDKINSIHDYSKDLQSYLNYCQDIVFAGRPTSFEEERLIERLWDIYEKPEDSNPKEEFRRDDFNSKGKRPRDVAPRNTSPDSKKQIDENQGTSLYADKGKQTSKVARDCSHTTARNAAVEKMKHDMEENGFQYLPPRAQCRTDSYLHYTRQSVHGKLVHVAHADYYILLRACARLACVDARIMHAGVLKLERRLGWIEKRISSSLSSPPK